VVAACGLAKNKREDYLMPKPIVIAHHLIWTAYGSWLPNDPRGSTSEYIASDIIAELGQLHRGRRKVQPTSSMIREFHNRAKCVLKFPLLKFSADEFNLVAEGLQDGITEHKYTCYACAVMPDHVHILIRKHKHQAEEMIENLQHSSRLRLSTSGIRSGDHPVWTQGGGKVFLDHPDAIRDTIQYIEDNPLKWRLPRQYWPFVMTYDGWPFHIRHSPNSPYVKRLRNC
jgi:REP element-mobilizing transposase RayT